MNLLIDVNIALDVCAKREPFYTLARDAIQLCQFQGGKLWLYVGSVQTLEYNLFYELKRSQAHTKPHQTTKELFKKSCALLQVFAKDKQWLAALADEGNVFSADDPEDEQLIRALDRFPKGSAKLLTRDKPLQELHPNKTISPQVFIKENLENPKKPKIDFANLDIQQDSIRPELEKNIHQVLQHGKYIMGEEITLLEGKLQEFTGAKHAITCSNGTDALLLAMMAMDIQPDDEIITTPFTFIATAETIALMKAKPVFVDIEEDTYNIDATKIEAAITNKTKAIMPVSLYGQPADMDAIQAIADKHNIKVIVDGAQSFGSTYKDKTDSKLGNISTTSFFPAKPLGCYGDGGAVFTNNDEYAEKMKLMRVHGQNKRYHHKYIGMGGRLDTIQAAILLAKLPHYKNEIEMRQKVATTYTASLNDSIIKPTTKEGRTSVWAQYTVRVKNRDQVQNKLKEEGIPTAVHYPMPLHLQECFQYLGYKKGGFPIAELVSNEVMSLPMNPFLTEEEISAVTQSFHA